MIKTIKQNLDIVVGTYDEIMGNPSRDIEPYPTKELTFYFTYDTRQFFLGNAFGKKIPYSQSGDVFNEENILALIKAVDERVDSLAYIAGGVEDRPINPQVGSMYFDTTLGLPIWFNGENWVSSNGDIL